MSIANSAEQVSPLLKGSKVPNTPLTRMNGKSVSLMQIIDNKPAVLIFYRGSW